MGLGVVLAAMWLLLSGHYTPLILGFGSGSVVLVVYLAHRMDVADHEGVPLYLGGRLLGYIPWLMKEILVANIAVAKVILHPKLPISPIMVHFKGTQKTDMGRFIYANSITLTPGTITTGVEGNEFEIHALTFHDVDGREEDEMDRRCTLVEGEAE
jgi:multicomponent Na+:H+ antiporter subunit E